MGVTQFVNAMKGLPISELTLLRILEAMTDEKLKAIVTIAFQILSTVLKIALYIASVKLCNFLIDFF